ncbi:hypothetical protein ACTXN7_11730 [Corynebacterium flavescens]|uniref:hypothetical protein n=1 Tax=Corynebacterium flavescens TaxID=28028 RepID=UPI003FCFE453
MRKLRTGFYCSDWLMEPHLWAERAQITVIAPLYLDGVSIRRADDRVPSLRISNVLKIRLAVEVKELILG